MGARGKLSVKAKWMFQVMMLVAYVKGAVTGVNCGSVHDNPYAPTDQAFRDWLVGYRAGIDAERRGRALQAGAGEALDKTDCSGPREIPV